MSERVPEGWNAKNLGENLVTLTDYTANGSFAALKENVTYYSELNYAALVRTTDLEKREFEPQRFTDKQGFEFLSKSTLYENDIVVANVGSAGKAYKVPKCSIPMTLAPNMYLVKFNAENVDRNFAFQVLIWDETIRQLKRSLGTMNFVPFSGQFAY